MRRKVEGICKLCGKKVQLSYEHVPPESAFNSFPVKEYPPDEYIKAITGEDGRLPWEFDGLRGKINQRGEGGYYLCESCNNNTGSWYIPEYERVAQLFHKIITEEKMTPGSKCSFHVEKMRPLLFFKAALTMFCDIGNECFGDSSLRQFILDKESNAISQEKYCLTLCMISPGMRRTIGFAVIPTEYGMIQLSEILCYPVGITLYINKPKNFNPPGLIINDFSKCSYNEEYSVDFSGLPYYEINSTFPNDFRSKEDFPRYKAFMTVSGNSGTNNITGGHD